MLRLVRPALGVVCAVIVAVALGIIVTGDAHAQGVPTSTIGPTITPRLAATATLGGASAGATSTIGPTLTPPPPTRTPVTGPTSTLGPSSTPLPATRTAQAAPSATPTHTPTSASTTTPTATVTRTATPGPSATPSRTPTPTATLPPLDLGGLPLAGWTVALDPGHGGRDPGALYHGLRESEVNLAIALGTRPLLQEAGARVVLTRDRDVMVGPADGTITQDLEARAQIANRAGAHLFVSIHANVHSDPDVAGAITFYGVEQGYAGGQHRSQRQVELSWHLADAVQRGVVRRAGETDRGVRPANFWVLGATTMPSVLLEAGFLTNEAEARNLAEPAFRRRIAEGIAQGLVAYVTGGQVLPTDRAPSMASAGNTQVRYYEATGHNVAYGFKHFFDTRGGLDIFGYPRTEELTENGWTVQYFQRARFEYHPEHAGTPYEVELGLLGDAVTEAVRPFPPGAPFPSGDDHRWYPETGHGLHYGFLRYFDTRGGLDVFGYPIGEELQESGYTVQYFQRARFEYHPEHAATPYEVQLGLLGDQALQQKRWLR